MLHFVPAAKVAGVPDAELPSIVGAAPQGSSAAANGAAEGTPPPEASGDAASDAAAAPVVLSSPLGTNAFLVSSKQNAAVFDATEIPLSTAMLNGQDYTSARSVKVRA